jgi:glycerol-3-phosphate dehydrogenase (NAD(P)+)
LFCENQDEIAWYMRSTYAIEHLKQQKHNPNYLSSVSFDTSKLKLTNDINEAVAFAEYIIFVVPSAFLSKELENLTESLNDKIIFYRVYNIEIGPEKEQNMMTGLHKIRPINCK